MVWDGATTYVHADGIQQAIDGTGNARYHLTDALGSVRGVYDLSGTQTAATEYDVFGDARSSSGTSSVFGYTGEQQDPTTGFVHLRARDDDPMTGRLTSRDVVQPNAKGTQGYNRYSYVANNPCSATDPSGHCVGWVVDEFLGSLLGAMIIAAALFVVALGRSVYTGVAASAVLIAQARAFVVGTFILLAFCFWLWAQWNQPGMGDAGEQNPDSPAGPAALPDAPSTYPAAPSPPAP